MVVLHIILGILKVVGILLLVLLALILLTVLAVLFCPLTYQAKGEKEASSYGGSLKITWLFHLISVKLFFGNQEEANGCRVRILGIPLEKVSEFLARRREKKEQKQKAELTTVETKSRSEGQKPHRSEESQSHQEPEIHGNPVKEALGEEEETDVFRKIFGFFRKFGLTVRRICDKIDKIKDFLESERFKRLKALFLLQGKRMISHIRPRKVQGYVKMGTEDPCMTGEILAVAGIFFPLYGEHFTIDPCFDQNILEGNIFIKGRIYGIFFVHLALKLFLDSDIRFMVKKLKQS